MIFEIADNRRINKEQSAAPPRIEKRGNTGMNMVTFIADFHLP
jgi:hypothetical protein